MQRNPEMKYFEACRIILKLHFETEISVVNRTDKCIGDAWMNTVLLKKQVALSLSSPFCLSNPK